MRCALLHRHDTTARSALVRLVSFFPVATPAPAAGSQPQPQYKDSHFIGISSFPYMFYNIKHTIFFVDREHIPIRLVGASPGNQVAREPSRRFARGKTEGEKSQYLPFCGKREARSHIPKKIRQNSQKVIFVNPQCVD